MSQPEYGLWITCRGFPSQFSTIEKHNSKDRTRQRQVKVLKKEKPACLNTSKGPVEELNIIPKGIVHPKCILLFQNILSFLCTAQE